MTEKRFFDTDGFDADGFDAGGLDIDGYNTKGFNAKGFNANGFDVKGFDSEGYNYDGYDRDGDYYYDFKVSSVNLEIKKNTSEDTAEKKLSELSNYLDTLILSFANSLNYGQHLAFTHIAELFQEKLSMTVETFREKHFMESHT